MTGAVTLGDRLAAGAILHLPAHVTHARRGGIRHAFAYGVDFVLFSPDAARGRGLFSRNRWNLFAVHDRDHGGPRGAGEGAVWARRVLAGAGIDAGVTLALMAQPRFLGYWFNPVSFWLAFRGDDLLAVIAEVSNTFGQRHSYLCTAPGLAPIRPGDEITAAKVFHVSPYQDVQGEYRFRFALTAGRIAIRIAHIDGDQGLIAVMQGTPAPLTTRALIFAAFARPGGALRVLGAIYWHALRLKLKGARYRPLPPAPGHEVSR